MKTLLSGALFTRHLPIPIDRFEHCEFTAAEALISFAALLLYTGDLGPITGVGSVLAPDETAKFETMAKRHGVPYRLQGQSLKVVPPEDR